MDGAEMIQAERKRQIKSEGWTLDHDIDHELGELVEAAYCYLRFAPTWFEPGNPPPEWPWGPEWWKPCEGDRVRELVKAGALIAAEIDRII